MALVHRWKFENDLNDSVGSSNGSNTNCTFYPNNNINGNYSIYIPKTPTGYPTFPSINISSYANFTWAFWFRSVISGVQQYLVMDWTYPGGPDERLSLVLNTNNRLVIYPYIGGNFRPIYSTTYLNIAAWNHVVLTASGTGSTYFTLYLNGKYDISGTQPRSTYNTNTFRLGVHSPGVTAAKFDGYMDDFRFYDTALTETEVRELYNSYFTDVALSLMSLLI